MSEEITITDEQQEELDSFYQEILEELDKDEIELEVNTRAIRISGHRGPPAFSDKNSRYCLAEMQLGPFERVLILPSPINTGEVSATYSNGLLQVRMTKLQIGKTRRIQIVER